MNIPTRAQMLKGIETPEGFEREVQTKPKTNWQPAYKVLKLWNDTITIEIEFFEAKPDPDAYFLASGHVTFKTPGGGTRTFDRYGVEDSFYIDNPTKFGDRLYPDDRVNCEGRMGTVVSTSGYHGWGDARTYIDANAIVWDDSDPAETVIYTDSQMKRRKIKKHIDIIGDTNRKIQKFINVKIPEALQRIERSEKIPGIPFEVTPERKKSVTQDMRNGKSHTFTPSGFGTGYVLSPKSSKYNKRAKTETEEFFAFSPIYVGKFDAD